MLVLLGFGLANTGISIVVGYGIAVIIRTAHSIALAHKANENNPVLILLQGTYIDLLLIAYEIWDNAEILEPVKVKVKKRGKDVFYKMSLLLQWVKRDVKNIEKEIEKHSGSSGQR